MNMRAELDLLFTETKMRVTTGEQVLVQPQN